MWIAANSRIMHELLRTGKLLATTTAIADYLTYTPGGRGEGGGHLGIFWVGMCRPPGTSNWHPVLKKNSPKIDTPF